MAGGAQCGKCPSVPPCTCPWGTEQALSIKIRMTQPQKRANWMGFRAQLNRLCVHNLSASDGIHEKKRPPPFLLYIKNKRFVQKKDQGAPNNGGLPMDPHCTEPLCLPHPWWLYEPVWIEVSLLPPCHVAEGPNIADAAWLLSLATEKNVVSMRGRI